MNLQSLEEAVAQVPIGPCGYSRKVWIIGVRGKIPLQQVNAPVEGVRQVSNIPFVLFTSGHTSTIKRQSPPSRAEIGNNGSHACYPFELRAGGLLRSRFIPCLRFQGFAESPAGVSALCV